MKLESFSESTKVFERGIAPLLRSKRASEANLHYLPPSIERCPGFELLRDLGGRRRYLYSAYSGGNEMTTRFIQSFTTAHNSEDPRQAGKHLAPELMVLV